MVKEFLSQKGLTFKERDVSIDRPAAQDLVRTTGQMGVPVTIVDGQVVIGFDRARLESVIAQSSSTQRPNFGATIADAGKITAQKGIGITLGTYIVRVKPGSAAEKIGLVADDIITELNMQRITNMRDLEQVLSKMHRGSRFTLVFLRGSQQKTTEGIL